MFTESTAFKEAMTKVDVAVKTYNSSLGDLALVVVIDNRNDVKKIRTTVDATFNSVQEIRDVFGKQRVINDGSFPSVAMLTPLQVSRGKNCLIGYIWKISSQSTK
jgi:hypothetical protein